MKKIFLLVILFSIFVFIIYSLFVEIKNKESASPDNSGEIINAYIYKVKNIENDISEIENYRDKNKYDSPDYVNLMSSGLEEINKLELEYEDVYKISTEKKFKVNELKEIKNSLIKYKNIYNKFYSKENIKAIYDLRLVDENVIPIDFVMESKNIYIADKKNRSIYIYNIDSNSIVQQFQNSKLTNISKIELLDNNRIIILDKTAGLYILDIVSGEFKIILSTVSNIEEIEPFKNGDNNYIYILNPSENKIQRIEPVGNSGFTLPKDRIINVSLSGSSDIEIDGYIKVVGNKIEGIDEYSGDKKVGKIQYIDNVSEEIVNFVYCDVDKDYLVAVDTSGYIWLFQQDSFSSIDNSSGLRYIYKGKYDSKGYNIIDVSINKDLKLINFVADNMIYKISFDN